MDWSSAVLAMRAGERVFLPHWDTRKEVEPGAYLVIEKRQDPEAPGGERDEIVRYPGVGAKVGEPWKALTHETLSHEWETRDRAGEVK